MNNSVRKIGLALAISIPIIMVLIFVDLQQRSNEEEREQQPKQSTEDYTTTSTLYRTHQKETETQTEIIEKPLIKHTGWIPPWDYQRGVESLTNFETEFNSISPVVFSVNEDGTINPRLDTNLPDLKAITEEKDIKLIPTISNFDWQVMKNIFDDSEKTERHIQSIVRAVEANNYDGIDLDYESLSIDNKEHFLEFIKTLASELQQRDKILSVTVLPKWGDDVTYTGLAETRQVQDWEIISKYADEVRIMTYDFTQPGSNTPGPIAPINWVEKVLNYAIEKIPREKIWVGIPLYSYEWVMPTSDPHTNPIDTNSYTYSIVKNNILTQENIETRYNEQFEEGYANYECQENRYCIIYYANPKSVQKRQELAQKHQIAGVAYWRLGGEGELIK